MNMIDWANKELDLYFSDDKVDKKLESLLRSNVIEVLKVLCNQGHTGWSAPMIMSFIKKLWAYKPLTPLTGEDEEWDDNNQNQRCFRVFKDDKGAYDSDGIIFENPDGSRFTSRESRVYIEFPYMPKSKVYKLKYDSDEVPVKEQLEKGWYEHVA